MSNNGVSPHRALPCLLSYGARTLQYLVTAILVKTWLMYHFNSSVDLRTFFFFFGFKTILLSKASRIPLFKKSNNIRKVHFFFSG